MSGYAGLLQSKNLKQENNISSEHLKSLSKVNAGLAVGQVALIVNFFPSQKPSLYG